MLLIHLGFVKTFETLIILLHFHKWEIYFNIQNDGSGYSV